MRMYRTATPEYRKKPSASQKKQNRRTGRSTERNVSTLAIGHKQAASQHRAQHEAKLQHVSVGHKGWQNKEMRKVVTMAPKCKDTSIAEPDAARSGTSARQRRSQAGCIAPGAAQAELHKRNFSTSA